MVLGILMISSYMQRTFRVVCGINAAQDAEENEMYDVLCGGGCVWEEQVRAQNRLEN